MILLGSLWCCGNSVDSPGIFWIHPDPHLLDQVTRSWSCTQDLVEVSKGERNINSVTDINRTMVEKISSTRGIPVGKEQQTSALKVLIFFSWYLGSKRYHPAVADPFTLSNTKHMILFKACNYINHPEFGPPHSWTSGTYPAGKDSNSVKHVGQPECLSSIVRFKNKVQTCPNTLSQKWINNMVQFHQISWVKVGI